MKRKIFLILLFLIGLSAGVYGDNAGDERIEIMGITLSYFSGEFEIKDVYVITGFPSKESEFPTHVLKILDKKNRDLYSIKFTIEDVYFSPPKEHWFDEDGNQIYIPELGEQEFVETIFVPYLKDGYYITVEDLNGNELLRDEIKKWFGIISDDIKYEIKLDKENDIKDNILDENVDVQEYELDKRDSIEKNEPDKEEDNGKDYGQNEKSDIENKGLNKKDKTEENEKGKKIVIWFFLISIIIIIVYTIGILYLTHI